MKKSLYIFLFLGGNYLWGQNPSISPQVINSAGNEAQVGSSGIWITSNIGEPFTETLGPNSGVMLTQGFIQPEIISVGGFTMTPLINHLSCTNKNDGGIILEILKPAPYTLVSTTFLWKDTTLCPTHDCSSLTNLKAGTYGVNVIVSYSNAVGVLKTDTLVNDSIVVNDPKTPCLVKIFTGITLNNDGTNDVFTIDNIDQFPNNHVLIFNRWGQQVADIKGYDNVTKFWPEKDATDKLVASTYFYIVELGDGSKVLKGWVELMKR